MSFTSSGELAENLELDESLLEEVTGALAAEEMPIENMALDPDEVSKEEVSPQAFENAEEEPRGAGLRELMTPDGKTTIIRVHPETQIGEGVRVGAGRGPLGRGTVIGAGSLILGALYANTTTGKNVIVRLRACIGSIGDIATMGEIILEDETDIGAGTRIHLPTIGEITRIGAGTQIGARAKIGEPGDKPVTIGKDSVIGKNTIIRPGAIIGDRTKIDPGYTVVKDVELPGNMHIAMHPVRKGRKPIIGEHWEKELKSYITYT